MAATQQTLIEEMDGERKSAKAVVNESLAEGIVGGGVVVLTFTGLLNIMPELMLPVSAILTGAAFLIEGETISVRASRLLAKASRDRVREDQPGVGATAQFVSGITGVVLGFLALLGLYPLVMVPIAVIVYGSALMFTSGLTARLNDLEVESSGEPACFTRIVCEAMTSASGIEFVFGLIAGILGIIALTGMETAWMSLAALLVVGAGSLLNGTAIIARIAGTQKKQAAR